ncbi:MAG: glycosyl hydrolase family 65 protein [Fimbriimonadaceae bacterium]
MLRAVAIGLLAILLAAGCAKSGKPTASPPKLPVDPWVLETNQAEGEPAFFSNGLIGGRIDRFGMGTDEEGRSLPFLAVDVRQPSGEEKILPLPNPMGLRFVLAGRALPPDASLPLRQAISLRDGVVTSEWGAKAGRQVLRFRCLTVVARNHRVVAQRWTVSPLPKDLVAQPRIPTQLEPDGILRVAEDPVPIRGRLLPRVDGWDWIVACGKPSGSPATDAAVSIDEWDFERAARESEEFWKARWNSDILIEGPAEDQRAVRAMLFSLRANINPLSGFAPGPYGLTSATYNGHVFWDADVWIFPALALLDPDLAGSIPEYRLRMFRQRLREGLRPGEQPFPWESSVSGRETVPGPSQKEIHIVGSVCLGLEWAEALGLVRGRELADVWRYSAAFFRQRATRGREGLLELRDVMSPDEHHTGDNDLYTNLLAEWLLNDRSFVGPRRFVRPMADGHFATYDGDRLRGYKQTAALLAIYPLQHPEAEAQATKMIAAFLGKTAANGPAMSLSVESLILARHQDPERAYRLWRDSWSRYTNGALGLFNEKPRRESSVFLTGAGGCLQTILYGFAGFRIDSKPQDMAGWSRHLDAGKQLSMRPALPSAWRSMTLRNISVRGRKLTLTITRDKILSTQGD